MVSKRSLITFNATLILFLFCIESVTAADHLAAPAIPHGIGKVKNQNEYNRMLNYLEKHVDINDIRGTIYLSDGDIVDCVDFENQPAVKALKARGEKLSPLVHVELNKSFPKLAAPDQMPAVQTYFEDGVYCGQGQIPILRPSIELMKNFETLEDFLARKPHHAAADNTSPTPVPAQLRHLMTDEQIEEELKPIVQPQSRGRLYAKISQDDTNITEAHAILNVWSPYTENKGNNGFSNAQVWVWGGSRSDGTLGSVEAGWIVYPAKFGSGPRLFVYGTGDNYRTGCYNVECTLDDIVKREEGPGFIQTDKSVVLGGQLKSSVVWGTQYVLQVYWERRSDGNWWLFVGGEFGSKYVGYYPAKMFSSANIGNGAQHFDVGGEVAYDPNSYKWYHCHFKFIVCWSQHTHYKVPPTDMGSGEYPLQTGNGVGTQLVAFVRNISYTSNGLYKRPSNATADQIVTNGNCYNLEVNLDRSDWYGATIWFGGEGSDHSKCNDF